RTAVVRALCEPRSPCRHANGGETAGSSIRSTSTAAIRIAAYHHTNDEVMSRAGDALPLGPGAFDVRGDQGPGALAVPLHERLVDVPVVGDRLLELRPGVARAHDHHRGAAGVPVDRPD